jgi:hypothetical protein
MTLRADEWVRQVTIGLLREDFARSAAEDASTPCRRHRQGLKRAAQGMNQEIPSIDSARRRRYTADSQRSAGRPILSGKDRCI